MEACTAIDFGYASARLAALLQEANRSETSFHSFHAQEIYPTFTFCLIRLPAAVAWLVELDYHELDRALELAERVLLPTAHVPCTVHAMIPSEYAAWRPADLKVARDRIVMHMLFLASHRANTAGWPLSVTPRSSNVRNRWFTCTSASDPTHKYDVRLDEIHLRRALDSTHPGTDFPLGTRGFLRGLPINAPHLVVINCVGSFATQTTLQVQHYAELGRPYPDEPDRFDEQKAHELLALVIMSHIFTKRADAHLDARHVDGDFRAALGDLSGEQYDKLHEFVTSRLLPTSTTVRRALAVLERGLPQGHSHRERAELVQDVHDALAWVRFRFPAVDDEVDHEPRRGLPDHSLGSAHSRARRDRRRLAASSSSRF
ncbi:hypothetical protein JCM9279_001668 [Rhodotorula babjevae]